DRARPGPRSGGGAERGAGEGRVPDGVRGRHGVARPRLRELGHVPRLRRTRGSVRRGRARAREGGRAGGSSGGGASPRPRPLQLVRPDERPISRARTDLRTRRTLALLLGSTAFLARAGLVIVLVAGAVFDV